MKAGSWLFRGAVLASALFLFSVAAHAADGDAEKKTTAPRAIDSPIDPHSYGVTVPLPVGTVLKGPETSACKHEYEGALRYSKQHKTLMVCDGEHWLALQGEKVSD